MPEPARQETAAPRRIRLMVHQRYFPHYRLGIFRALSRHPEIDFTLLQGAQDGPGAMVNVRGCPEVKRWVEPTRTVGPPGSPFYWMPHLVKAGRSGRCDLLLVQNDFTCLSFLPALVTARKHGVKIGIYSIGFGQRRQPLRDWLRIRIAHYVDVLVLYSYAHRERYIARGVPAEKIFVAPNAIDTQEIQAAERTLTEEALQAFRTRHGLAPGATLIHVGRMVERKRLDLLLHAAAGLVRDFPRLKVVLVGDGPMLEAWQALAARLGLQEHVLWPGRVVEQSQLCYWMRCADVCIAPAQVGLLANLSHAYGVPLIVCDRPELQGPEIQVFTEGRTGLVYRFGDVEDLRNRAAGLLSDPQRRASMGRAARKVIYEDFTLEKQVQGFVEAARYAMRSDG